MLCCLGYSGWSPLCSTIVNSNQVVLIKDFVFHSNAVSLSFLVFGCNGRVQFVSKKLFNLQAFLITEFWNELHRWAKISYKRLNKNYTTKTQKKGWSLLPATGLSPLNTQCVTESIYLCPCLQGSSTGLLSVRESVPKRSHTWKW